MPSTVSFQFFLLCIFQLHRDGAIVSYKFQVVDKSSSVVVFDPPAGPAAIVVTPSPGLFPEDYVASLVVTDNKGAVSKVMTRGFSEK